MGNGAETVHDLTTQVLCQTHGLGLHTKKFRKSVLGLIKHVEEGAYDEEEWKINVVPDAYKIDYEAQEIHVYEVEDSSKLTPNKLMKYCDLFMHLDCIFIDLKLFVSDRWGTVQPVCLFSYWAAEVKSRT